jgi:hypothetical protein
MTTSANGHRIVLTRHRGLYDNIFDVQEDEQNIGSVSRSNFGQWYAYPTSAPTQRAEFDTQNEAVAHLLAEAK